MEVDVPIRNTAIAPTARRNFFIAMVNNIVRGSKGSGITTQDVESLQCSCLYMGRLMMDRIAEPCQPPRMFRMIGNPDHRHQA